MTYRCRRHGYATEAADDWAHHLELHEIRFHQLLSEDPRNPSAERERVAGMMGRRRSTLEQERLGGGLADTMRGGAEGGPGTARVHGIRLRDRGYTDVGKETMTRQEWLKGNEESA